MNLTEIILLSTVAFLLIYDFLAYASKGFYSTISYALYSNGMLRPIIAVLVGIVIGHVWWPIDSYQGEKNEKCICTSTSSHPQ